MRKWAIVLHLYQSPVQDLGITKNVLQSCYLPLLKLIRDNSHVRLTLNIAGCLVEQLAKMQQQEFFDLLREVVDSGQVELLNSPADHPVIPLTPRQMIDRQTETQKMWIKETTGRDTGKGFFPPELAVDEQLINWSRGKYDYVLVDETAVQSYRPAVMYKGQKLVVNCRVIADIFRGYQGRLKASLVEEAIRNNTLTEPVLVTINDAEAFGHHYQERLELLAELWRKREWKFVQAGEVAVGPAETVEKVATSSWQVWLGNDRGNRFKLWASEENSLQQQYLAMMKIAAETVDEYKDQTAAEKVKMSLEYLDKGCSSCYLYWLSAWPWWHPDLVQKGADQLVRSVRSIEVPLEVKRQLEERYHEFLKQMWLYHWSGEIEKKYKEYDEMIKNK